MFAIASTSRSVPPRAVRAPQEKLCPQGIPDEVSAADLSFAFGATSANTNGVQLLGLTVSDPPTQSELQAVANKIDELINASRR